jgi:hypothetical protein
MKNHFLNGLFSLSELDTLLGAVHASVEVERPENTLKGKQEANNEGKNLGSPIKSSLTQVGRNE